LLSLSFFSASSLSERSPLTAFRSRLRSGALLPSRLKANPPMLPLCRSRQRLNSLLGDRGGPPTCEALSDPSPVRLCIRSKAPVRESSTASVWQSPALIPYPMFPTKRARYQRRDRLTIGRSVPDAVSNHGEHVGMTHLDQRQLDPVRVSGKVLPANRDHSRRVGCLVPSSSGGGSRPVRLTAYASTIIVSK
jgi:hypothetical protein